MVTAASDETLYALSEDDIEIEHIAPGAPGSPTALFVTPAGRQIPLSGEAALLVERLIEHLSRGRAAQVIVYDNELTTQQAAEILNVSRQYLIRLLDRGDIPYTRTGTHRRLRLADVLAYRAQRSQVRREALQNMARASQESGDY